jgi:hypothetical protein
MKRQINILTKCIYFAFLCYDQISKISPIKGRSPYTLYTCILEVSNIYVFYHDGAKLGKITIRKFLHFIQVLPALIILGENFTGICEVVFKKKGIFLHIFIII